MTHRQLVETFLAGLSRGAVDDALLSDDMVFWSINSGESVKARFQQGIALLAQVANHSIVYRLDSLITDGDRLVAEVSSHGTLMDGSSLQNQHVFLFALQQGRIAEVREFMNQFVVAEKVAPLMQKLMNQQS